MLKLFETMRSKKRQTVSSFHGNKLTTSPVLDKYEMSTVKERSHIANAHLKIIPFLGRQKRQRHALNKALQGFVCTSGSCQNITDFCRKNFEFALIMNVYS